MHDPTILPATGFVRLKQIVGDQNSNPPITPILPISRSTWYAGIKAGRFPAPIKLSKRISAWAVEDIRALLDSFRWKKP